MPYVFTRMALWGVLLTIALHPWRDQIEPGMWMLWAVIGIEVAYQAITGVLDARKRSRGV